MNYYQKNCDGIMHTVKKGDTLYRLSRMYSVSVDDIMDANPDVNVYNLQMGSSVCIPMTLPAVPLMPDHEPVPVALCPGCASRLPEPARAKGRTGSMPEQPQDGQIYGGQPQDGQTDGVQPQDSQTDGVQPSMDGADGQQAPMDETEEMLTSEAFTATQAMKGEMSEDSDQIPTEFVFPGMSLINMENAWNEDEGNENEGNENDGNEGWQVSEDPGDNRTYAPPFDWELQRRTLEGDNSDSGEAAMPDDDGDPSDWVVIQPHRVVRGETINSILETFNMDFETFARINPQIMPIPLMPGDTIFVKGNRPQPRADV